MRQYEDWRFTKGAVDPPDEYVDYLLCHHIFPGRLPSEIDQLPALIANLFIDFYMKEHEPKGKKRTVLGKRKRGTHQYARNPHPSNG